MCDAAERPPAALVIGADLKTGDCACRWTPPVAHPLSADLWRPVQAPLLSLLQHAMSSGAVARPVLQPGLLAVAV